ncbi:type IV pilus assembly protein PilM [Candidatus Desantisbacteria bacterium]|nr:type IV pilus assembly protein PilM [Candidatus Desantisbacteria bacterium]
MPKLFSKPEITMGLDIGSRLVKLVQLRHTNKGIELMNVGMDTIPDEAIVDGTVMDIAPVVKVIQALLKQLNIKNPDVNTAIAGKAVIVKKVKLPYMSREELNESIRWEAEQFIPFDMDDVNIDFQILSTNVEMKNMDVLLAAAKKEKLNNHLNLIRAAGLKTIIIDLDAFAVENAYEFNLAPEPDTVIALINLGCSITNINVIHNEIPLFTRDITMGGNNFTKALQKELLLNFDEAENIKINFSRESAKSNTDLSSNTFDKDVHIIIEKIMEELSMEISHSFEYYHSSQENKKITKVVLSGGAAKTFNLSEYLTKKLGVKVEINNPLKKIIINENKFDIKYIQSIAPILTVAIGLALRQGIE